jgi:PAS domain S-box-containing protein
MIEILLIEDNPGDVNLVQIYLREAFPGNHSLVSADRLVKGLASLEKKSFDIVITDLALPDSYGMETFEKVLTACPEIPVIVFTGYGDEQFGINAVAQGAADFLSKNQLDSNLLRRSIIYSIERNSLRKQLIAHTKSLEESEKKYRSLFEESKDAIFISTTAGKFINFNHAGAELFGYSVEEIGSINLLNLCYNLRESQKLKDALKANKSIRDFEIIFQTKNRNLLQCLLTVTLHETDKGDPVYHGIIRDITHQRSIEELHKAKEIAEKTAQARQEFLSVMSHELRTPLTSVIGVTQILISENPKRSQLKYLDILKSSSRNLLRLINNILDFSKIDAGKIQLERISFNFRKLVHGVMDSYMPQAEEKKIRLQLTMSPAIPESLKGDPVRLTQVLDNLITNAIKFTDEGKVSLTIETVSDEENEMKLLFEIRDTGIGIEKSKQEEIFESFTQAKDNISRIYGGTGLGLTISKKLVELMGGKIAVESEAGKGSAFSFDLTFQKSSKSQNEDRIPAPLEKNALEGIRILLAEDNPTNQQLTKLFLNKWGADVDCADNGKIAVEKIKENKYDLVLMDLQMPEMNGYEANEIIRSKYSLSELPVIAVTAYASAEDKMKVFKSGMNDFITKPIDTNEMYEKILKNVNRKPGSAGVSAYEEGESNASLSLRELVESYKDEPEFIRSYLETYESEFMLLPEKVAEFSLQKDCQSLIELIHKTFPSIKRIEHSNLSNELNQLKVFLSENHASDEEISEVTNEIRKSCNDVVAHINELKTEYLK